MFDVVPCQWYAVFNYTALPHFDIAKFGYIDGCYIVVFSISLVSVAKIPTSYYWLLKLERDIEKY